MWRRRRGARGRLLIRWGSTRWRRSGGLMNGAASEVDGGAPFDSRGIDSLAAIGMRGGLAGWLGRDLPATLMWDYASIDAIAAGLAGREDAPARPATRPGVIDLQP